MLGRSARRPDRRRPHEAGRIKRALSCSLRHRPGPTSRRIIGTGLETSPRVQCRPGTDAAAARGTAVPVSHPTKSRTAKFTATIATESSRASPGAYERQYASGANRKKAGSTKTSATVRFHASPSREADARPFGSRLAYNPGGLAPRLGRPTRGKVHGLDRGAPIEVSGTADPVGSVRGWRAARQAGGRADGARRVGYRASRAWSGGVEVSAVETAGVPQPGPVAHRKPPRAELGQTPRAQVLQHPPHVHRRQTQRVGQLRLRQR